MQSDFPDKPVDNATLERLLRENTDLTRQYAVKVENIHRILVGEPEYKREGLVEKVDRHDKLIIKGGAGFCTILFAWEIFKAIHPFN